MYDTLDHSLTEDSDETINRYYALCVYTCAKRSQMRIKSPIIHIRDQWITETRK